MSMPHKTAIYGKRLPAVQREWAAVARAIARFEPVKVVVPPKKVKQMRKLLGRKPRLIPLNYDDGWLRDNGPTVVHEGDGRTAIDWLFNGWGGAFDEWGQTWRKDNLLPGPLCKELGLARRGVDIVMEGGSLICDGEGTIITTEECLLNPNRNPSMTKQQIEDALLETLGAQKVIWLPWGLIGDLTSGHVDGVAMFIEPGKVLAQTAPDDPEEQAQLQENLDVLATETDAMGRTFEVVEFPFLPVGRFGGGPKVSHAYINFAFARDALVVPVAGLASTDAEALEFLEGVYPGREVVGVETPNISWAGGGTHCITQQLPAAP